MYVQRNINKSIVIMAGVYAQSFECKIEISNGGEAFTTENAIVIPKPKEELLDSTWGYCAHEAAHKRFTDLSLFAVRNDNPVLGWLLNVIEDTVIERKMLIPFPGVIKYFNHLASQVLKYQPDSSKTKETVIKDFIFYYIRGFLTGYDIWNDDTKALQSETTRLLGPFVYDALVDILNEVNTIDSTEQSLALARQVLTFLEETAQDNPPEDTQDQNDQEENQEESQSGENQSDGENSNNNQDANQDESCNDSSTGDTQSDEHQDNNNGDGQPDQQPSKGQDGDKSSANEPSKEGKQAVQSFIQAAESDLNDGDTGSLAEKLLSDTNNQEPLTQAEKRYHGKTDNISITVTQSETDDMSHQALGVTTKLSNSLLQLLESQTRTQRVTVKRGRKLAKSKVHRLVTGNTKIFKRKFEEREGIDCDVVVLADTSSSMGSDIHSVKVATFSLLNSLNQIEGCQSCCFEFGYDLAMIQQPYEPFSTQVKGRIASLKASGCTPATEAYWVATRALLNMSGSKKVVIMITDGDPDDPSSTKEMVDSLRANGVIVICLGVGLTEREINILNRVYGANKWQHVIDFNDLPRQLLLAAQQVL